MIFTVTLNPTIDQTLVLERFGKTPTAPSSSPNGLCCEAAFESSAAMTPT